MRLKWLKSKSILLLTVVVALLLAEGCTNMGNRGNGGNGGQVRQQNVPAPQQTPPNQNQAQTQGNKVDIANKAAEKMIGIPGVQQANVLVTQRNAYVAAVLTDNQTQLTPEIESKIAEQVRTTDPNIQNVYVSTNPDFVSRVNTYVNEVQQGRPGAGFFEQFNEMVNRIFPNAR